MASQGNSNTGVVAIFAIFLMVVLGGFVAYRMGVFGGGGHDNAHKVDVNLNTK